MTQRHQALRDVLNSFSSNSPASLTTAYCQHVKTKMAEHYIYDKADRSKEGKDSLDRRRMVKRASHLASIRELNVETAQLQMVNSVKCKLLRSENLGIRLLDAFIPTANAGKRLHAVKSVYFNEIFDSITRWSFTSQDLDAVFSTRKWVREIHHSASNKRVYLWEPKDLRHEFSSLILHSHDKIELKKMLNNYGIGGQQLRLILEYLDNYKLV